MKIGIITAMQVEHDQIAALLTDSTAMEAATPGAPAVLCGSLGVHTIVLAMSGIGKVNAALTAAALIATHRPDALISTGCAGGLAPEPGVMGVVAAASTVYHDVWCGEGNAYGQVQGLPARFEADARLLEVARALAADPTVDTPVCCGLTCTGDKFITDPDELSAVCRAFPEALAVDMESAAIAHTCYLHRVPFLSFRVISDTPGARIALGTISRFLGHDGRPLVWHHAHFPLAHPHHFLKQPQHEENTLLHRQPPHAASRGCM